VSDQNAEVLADAGAEVDSELQIQTTQDYHELRRYQQIHTARERFLRAELLAAGAPEPEQQRMREAAATAAMQYLRELEPIARRTDSELLQNEAVWLTQPAPAQHNHRSRKAARQRYMQLSYEELLQAGGTSIPWQVEYAYSDPHSGLQKTGIASAESTPPLQVLSQIVRHCDQFVESVLPFRLEEEDSPLVL